MNFVVSMIVSVNVNRALKERSGKVGKERYVIEGEWSGYKSSQRRICHRKVTTIPDYYRGLTSIRFTDDTTLDLRILKCNPREKVSEIDGYTSLIDKCIVKGVNSVEALHTKEKA